MGLPVNVDNRVFEPGWRVEYIYRVPSFRKNVKNGSQGTIVDVVCSGNLPLSLKVRFDDLPEEICSYFSFKFKVLPQTLEEATYLRLTRK
jgi:hypothetical protein